MADPPSDTCEELLRYLTPSERVVFVQHEHWIAVAEPIGTAAGAFVVLIWLLGVFNNSPGLTNVLVIIWFVVLGRAAYRVVGWRRDLFIGTSKRLLNLSGIISRTLATMPLSKVTDMSYIRSPWGKLLGYGTFRVESAGQDQALGTIKWVANPDETYRKIIGEQFKPATRRAPDGRPPAGSGSQLPVVEPDDTWWRR